MFKKLLFKKCLIFVDLMFLVYVNLSTKTNTPIVE